MSLVQTETINKHIRNQNFLNDCSVFRATKQQVRKSKLKQEEKKVEFDEQRNEN